MIGKNVISDFISDDYPRFVYPGKKPYLDPKFAIAGLGPAPTWG